MNGVKRTYLIPGQCTRAKKLAGVLYVEQWTDRDPPIYWIGFTNANHHSATNQIEKVQYDALVALKKSWDANEA